METKKPVVPEPEEIPLDKNNPDSIYNWVAKKISGPSFRNIIKDFIDDNCSLFIDIEENTFQQGQIFNEFNQLLENILGDVLQEGGLSQEQFLEAAQRGLEDKTYKKYFDQLLNFSDYTFFKRIMTKRNYTLIKKFEEQIEQQKKEEEEKKLEEEKQKELEKEIEKEKEKGKEKEENGGDKEEKKEKTERELEEEKQRLLLLQMLNQEEEKELQEVIKQSLAMEEEKRRIAVIEEEELNRALKQSLMESTNPTENKKEEPPKKEEPKKPVFQIQKNDNIQFENKPKEESKPAPTPQKPIVLAASSNNSFQFSGIEQKKDISTQPQPIPEKKKENLIDENNEDKTKEKPKREIQYIEPEKEESKKPEIEKVEIQRKKEEIIEKKPKPIINSVYDRNNYKNENNNNIINLEDNNKDENIIITNEIKTKINHKPQIENPIPDSQNQKASDIIKQSLGENKINENNNNINDDEENNDNDIGNYDRLLISDDEDEEEKPKENIEQKPLANAFIDKKNDFNLGKVRIGKDGGNFLNNFNYAVKNYEKGGIDKLEHKLKQQQQIQSVISNPDEYDDYLEKKNEKLKEYREKLTKMQKEKRENKAKQTLSPEELAKLQRRELLAQKLKAKRTKENNN